MTRVLHVIDSSTDETALQSLASLLRKIEPTEFHTICCVAPEALPKAARFLPAPIASAPLRIWPPLHYAPRLAELASAHRAELVHAWGIEAAATCAARLPRLPMALTVLDPAAASGIARGLRSFPKSACVVAGSQVIRSRLLAGGIAPDRIVVLRGGVDFAAINQAKAGRAIASPDRRGPTVLLHGPASRGAGQFYGLWACAIAAQIHGDLRVILPYDSTETRRLSSFVEQIKMEPMLIRPSVGATWPELLSDADMFLAPAAEEVCTEPLAAAMAAGVPIVATAVRSIAELIADKHNGFLCKPREPRALAGRILAAWEDVQLRRKIADTARGQAFEVFSLRTMADHYARLYVNLLSDAAPGDGIRDTAMAA